MHQGFSNARPALSGSLCGCEPEELCVSVHGPTGIDQRAHAVKSCDARVLVVVVNTGVIQIHAVATYSFGSSENRFSIEPFAKYNRGFSLNWKTR